MFNKDHLIEKNGAGRTGQLDWKKNAAGRIPYHIKNYLKKGPAT